MSMKPSYRFSSTTSSSSPCVCDTAEKKSLTNHSNGYFQSRLPSRFSIGSSPFRFHPTHSKQTSFETHFVPSFPLFLSSKTSSQSYNLRSNFRLMNFFNQLISLRCLQPPIPSDHPSHYLPHLSKSLSSEEKKKMSLKSQNRTSITK